MASETQDNTPTPPRATLRQKLWGLLRLRCPRCLQGKMFRGAFAMNDPCPVCGLVFQREEGYFLGSMYVSYVLSTIWLGICYFGGRELLPDWNDYTILALAVVLFLPLIPLEFRFARAIWIYFDRAGSTTGVPVGAYERARAREFKGPTEDRP